MDAVASCGFATTCHPPLFSFVSANSRGQQLGRHAIFPPYPSGGLVLCHSKLSFFKIMASKTNTGISIMDLQNEDDDITVVFEADDSNEEDRPNRSTNPKPSIKREPNKLKENKSELMLKLRKPGQVYDEGYKRKRIIPKNKPTKVKNELSNITLLQKPEVGKPYPLRKVSNPVSENQIPSELLNFQRPIAPQKSEYETYSSPPVQIPLLNKPVPMERKPQKEIPLTGGDELLEEMSYEHSKQYIIDTENRRTVPPIAKQVNIDLRKPSMLVHDDVIADPKPEPELDPLCEKETDLKLESELDLYEPKAYHEIEPQNEEKELLLKRYLELAAIDLRKPSIVSSDDVKPDPKPELEPNPLSDKETEVKLKSKPITEVRKPNMPSRNEIKIEARPVWKSNPLVESENYRTKFDTGVQEIGQDNFGGVNPDKNEEDNSSSACADASSEMKEWKDMQHLRVIAKRFIVELTGYNREGFFAIYGSLIGFVPFKNLGKRYKFSTLESWLNEKGANVAMYNQKLYTTRLTGTKNSNPELGLGTENLKENSILNLEQLLDEYEQEKDDFLSSFVGKRLKVIAVKVYPSSKRLVFSGLPKSKHDLLAKKRVLLVRLKVGEMVKCKIVRFSYVGIFVEVEGVPALIPHTQLFFEGTLDLLSSFSVGQVIDARVHELDFNLERITLSLRGITQDLVKNDFESSFGGNLKAVQSDKEWDEVELLIKELENTERVNSVSKGGFFLSSGLAPTFQVYMAPMVDDKYRLLARFGNKVQEVFVEASMDNEEMKSVIVACTSQVA